MALIKNGEIVEDSWIEVADDASIPATGDVIVGLDRLRKQSADLFARTGKVGVRLGVEDLVEDVEPFLDQLALVAVDFPRYVDGRGYSAARIIRERFGFQGELRSVGNVLYDQLYFMQRCGFDAFELEAGKDATGALGAFTEMSVKYQSASDQPLPLYRRR
jgi:uncharacterized protein (DUF934 family)